MFIALLLFAYSFKIVFVQILKSLRFHEIALIAVTIIAELLFT